MVPDIGLTLGRTETVAFEHRKGLLEALAAPTCKSDGIGRFRFGADERSLLQAATGSPISQQLRDFGGLGIRPLERGGGRFD